MVYSISTLLLYYTLSIWFSFSPEYLMLEIPLTDDHHIINDDNDDVSKELDRLRNDEDGMIMSENEAHRQRFDTLFPVKYYGVHYKAINVLPTGTIGIGASYLHAGSMRRIEAFHGEDKDSLVEVISNEQYIAIKWPSLRLAESETEDVARVMCIIHSNGNITIYLEKIPYTSENSTWSLMITDGYDYATRNKSGLYIIKTSYSQIRIPEKMIRSRTLVEFSPNLICSEQLSCEDCISASTLHAKCYWCPKINKCSHGFDIHRPSWINNTCYTKNITNCEDLTTLNTDQDLKTTPWNELNKTFILLTNNVAENITETPETMPTPPFTFRTTELTSQIYYNLTKNKSAVLETTTRTPSSFSTSEPTTQTSRVNLVNSSVVNKVYGNVSHPFYSSLFIFIPIIIILLIAISCIIWLCVACRRKSKKHQESTPAYVWMNLPSLRRPLGLNLSKRY